MLLCLRGLCIYWNALSEAHPDETKCLSVPAALMFVFDPVQINISNDNAAGFISDKPNITKPPGSPFFFP